MLQSQPPRLAEALLTRRSAAMTKADLLLLCAHWRLRSDRWRRRGHRPPRPLPETPSPPPEPTQLAIVERPLYPPPLRLDAPEALDAAAVWAHIGAVLRPLSLRCGPLLAGPGAAALASRDAAAARLYRAEIPAVRSLEADWAVQKAALPGLQLNVHAAEQALPATASSVPARSYPLPPAVLAVPALAQIGVAHFQQLLSFVEARMAEPGNSVAELTWLEEFNTVHASREELMAQIAALLAASARSSAATHVAVASMLIDLPMTHISADFSAFVQRRRWLETLPEAPGDAENDDTATRRKPLMAPMPTPRLESLPLGCFGAIAV